MDVSIGMAVIIISRSMLQHYTYQAICHCRRRGGRVHVLVGVVQVESDVSKDHRGTPVLPTQEEGSLVEVVIKDLDEDDLVCTSTLFPPVTSSWLTHHSQLIGLKGQESLSFMPFL